MKKIIINFITASLLLISPPVYAEEINYSSDESMDYSDHFSGEIWQPGEFKGGSSGVVRAKISCSSIEFEMNADGALDKYKKLLAALLPNPKLLAINALIRGGATLAAVQSCGGGLENMLMEYPEQAQKLIACVQAGVGDSNRIHAGGAVGTASFASLSYETVPGQGASISACMMNELADEMGESYRTCIHEQTQDNIQYIRDMMDFAMKFDFDMKVEAQQSCILEEQAKETDIVKAVNTYGSVINPDGTYLDCTEDECVSKKIAWSSFALTEDQDKEIKAYLLDYINDRYTPSGIQNSKKGAIYGFILDWYKYAFLGANIWQTEEHCNGILSLPSDDVVYKIGADKPEVNELYKSDKAALTETAEVMKNLCVSYIEYARDKMFTTAAERPMPAFNSAAQQEVWRLGQYKLSADMGLMNMAYEAKKTAMAAKERARKNNKDQFGQKIERAIERLKEIK